MHGKDYENILITKMPYNTDGFLVSFPRGFLADLGTLVIT